MTAQKTSILLLIFFIACALYPLFLGRFYAVGDMRDVFIPIESFFHAETLHGRLPAWMPDAAWGFPVIASAQIGFFYPPLLVARLLPVWIYLPALLFLHIAALGIGTFLFLRSLQRSQAAALLGGVSFALSAFVFQHISHLNITFATAWFPWQLLLMHRLAMKDKMSYHDFLKAALLFALPFLVGQLQVPLMLAAVSSSYFLCVRWQRSYQFVRSVGFIAALAFAVIALSAAQVLPTLELAQHSSRSATGDFSIERANQHSFPLYHLPTLLFPRFFGSDDTYWGKRLEVEYGFFLGTFPLLLAAWTLFSPKRTRALVPTTRFFTWLVVTSFLLALGSLSPFRVIGLEPSLWFFSAPARWLLFTTFSLSALAAFGYDALALRAGSFRVFAKWTAVFVAAGVLIANGILFSNTPLVELSTNWAQQRWPDRFSENQDYYQAKADQLVQSLRSTSVSLTTPATAVPLIILLAIPFLLPRRNGVIVLLLLTVAELVGIAASAVPTQSWTAILSPPVSLAALPQSVLRKQSRIISVREGGDTGAYFTNPATRANNATRAQQKELLLPLVHAQFGIAGIEWPASLDIAAHTAIRSQLSGNGYVISDRELASALNIGAIIAPHNLPLPNAIPSAQTADVLVYSIGARPRAEIVDAALAPIAGSKADYQEVTPAKVHLNADLVQPGTLLVRNSWYPGWTAQVGGHPAKVLPAQQIFQSLALPAGAHEIIMAFRPLSIYVGIGVTALSLAVLSMLAIRRP